MIELIDFSYSDLTPIEDGAHAGGATNVRVPSCPAEEHSSPRSRYHTFSFFPIENQNVSPPLCFHLTLLPHHVLFSDKLRSHIVDVHTCPTWLINFRDSLATISMRSENDLGNLDGQLEEPGEISQEGLVDTSCDREGCFLNTLMMNRLIAASRSEQTTLVIYSCNSLFLRSLRYRSYLQPNAKRVDFIPSCCRCLQKQSSSLLKPLCRSGEQTAENRGR